MFRCFLPLVLAALVSLPLGADACSCVPNPPPKEALAKASAVFSGKVLAVETEGRESKVTIQVATVWKGIKDAKVVVFTPSNGAACGVAFKKDESYLVYCYDDKSEKPVLRASLCSRTAPLASAKEDLKELGEGTMPGGK